MSLNTHFSFENIKNFLPFFLIILCYFKQGDENETYQKNNFINTYSLYHCFKISSNNNQRPSYHQRYP